MHRFSPFFITASSLLLWSVTAHPQPSFVQKGGPKVPDTIYFPFYNGVQMIEIDHLKRWQHTVDFYNGTQPRAISWSRIIPPPPPNEYLFRNTAKQIIKAFNNPLPLLKLTRAFAQLPLLPAKNKPWLNRPCHATKEIPVWLKTSHRVKDDYQFNGFYKIYKRLYTIIKRKEQYREVDFIMQPGELTGLIDSLGNIRIPMLYEAILPLQGELLVKKKGRWGIIDKNEQVRVPLEYDEAQGYSTNKDIVFYRKGQPVIAYDTESKTIVQTTTYDWIDTEAIANHQSDPLRNSGATVFMVRKNGKTGLIDASYREVTAPVYDYCYSQFRNGLTRVNRNKKWGYINTRGVEVIDCVYDDATEFAENTAKVLRNGRFYCINSRGQDTSGCDETWRDWEKAEYASSCFNGLTTVQREHTYGVINTKNEVVIPVMYDNLHCIGGYDGQNYFLQGYFRVRRQGKFGIIDTGGKEILPCIYDMIDDFKTDKGLSVIEINEKFGLVDKSFRILLPCVYEGLDHFTLEEQVIFIENNLRGIMDYNGRVLLKPQYDEINRAHNGWMQVKKRNLYGIIDTTGKEIIPIKYPQLGSRFYNGYLIAGSKKKSGFIDSTGTIVIPFIYDEVGNFEQPVAAVKKNGAYGFIDRSGKEAAPFVYERVNGSWRVDSTMMVWQDGKIGFVDASGRRVIPCIYDEARGFSPSKGYELSRNGQWIWVKPVK